MRIIRTVIIFVVLSLIIMPTPVKGDSPIIEFKILTPNTQPTSITTGPDGNVWFTETAANRIGRIRHSGVITEFDIPTADSQPTSITPGPDGNVWFTEFKGNKIGRIKPSGEITEYPIPTPNSQPKSIVTGPYDNLWFTESNAHKVARLILAGTLTEFPLPTIDAQPGNIFADHSDNLWFTEGEAPRIGEIVPLPDIKEITISSNYGIPDILVFAPDSTLWYTALGENKIGHITSTGQINQYKTRDTLTDIILDPDNNLWFTEGSANMIGWITPSGTVTEIPLPTANGEPTSITVGIDGYLYFTERGGNQIGRISPTSKDVRSLTGPSISAADIEQANNTAHSPCIGVKSPAGENPKPSKKWSGPSQVIDVSHIYCAIFTTNHGRMVAQLFPRIAPKNVNNFVFLAQNGFYDNITWHRVIADFVAQSGDPTGIGTGDAGYNNIPLEVVDGVAYNREGQLAIAHAAEPDSAGSQFFITLASLPHLNGQYTIIGQVVEGLSVLHQIKIRDSDQTSALPKGDPLISVRIVDLQSGSDTATGHSLSTATPSK